MRGSCAARCAPAPRGRTPRQPASPDVSRTRLVLQAPASGRLAPVVVTMSLDVGNLILALAGLSFIGLGAPAPSRRARRDERAEER